MMKPTTSFSVDNSDGVKRLFRGAVDLGHRLDNLMRHASNSDNLFQADAIVLRAKLRDCCERLMFDDPAGCGKKAEDLLWRKVYYDVIVTAKQLLKSAGSFNKNAVLTHLVAGIGTYHHILFRLHSEFGLQNAMTGDFLIPDRSRTTRDKDSLVSTKSHLNLKSKEWAVNSFHRCLVCLGDLTRYKLEMFGSNSDQLAVRYYSQASVGLPKVGMPHNQLGTLAASSSYGCDAAYHYMRCLVSQQSFEGSESNLERIFEKAGKLLDQCLPEAVGAEGLVGDAHKELVIKRCLAKFILLCQFCFHESKFQSSVQIEQLCQQVLQDFYDCLQFSLSNVPILNDGVQDMNSQRMLTLDESLIFKIVAMSLICIYRFKITGSNNQSAAVAFSLAIFSHLLHYVICRIQKALGFFEDCHPIMKTTVDTGLDKGNGDAPPCCQNTLDQAKVHRRTVHHIVRRRRRHRVYSLSLEDSDLSEAGEHSDDAASDSDNANHASDISEGNETEGEASSSEDTDISPSSIRIENRRNASDRISWKNCQSPKANQDGLENKETRINGSAVEDSMSHRMKVKMKNVRCKTEGNKDENHCHCAGRLLEIAKADHVLPSVKICADWLLCHPNIFAICAQNSPWLWSRVVTLLNLIHPVFNIDTKEIMKPEVKTAIDCVKLGTNWSQTLPLPEDVALRDFELLSEVHSKLRFDGLQGAWLSTTEETLIRLACLHQFGIAATKSSLTNVEFDKTTRMFCKVEGDNGSEGMIWPSTDQENKNAVEVQRKQLMENMAHLWLQAEVSALEFKVHSSGRPQMSPYLVPTTAVLTEHLMLLRQLLASKCCVVIIPRAVVQHLDCLKKDSLPAREAIRWLEGELHRGSRYLRPQKQHEQMSLSPMKYPKRKDKEAWDFFQVLECCKYLGHQAGSQKGNGRMVTLLVATSEQRSGHQGAENRPQLNITALALTADVKMESVETFISKMQTPSTKNPK